MRFLDLQLLRFGHFTDRVLEFERTTGLQIVFGANEAGKSTTLRAVSGLLFGIPENTADHHLHDMPELRIAARLQNSHGEELHIVRRKGRQNTLLDRSEKPLDDTILRPYLGATTRELFLTMFGLSHSALIEGGQALLEGQGELGESLFGAGLGVRGIHTIRNELEREAAVIFTARGKNPKLNQALSRFREAKKAVNEQTLRPREWQDKQNQLQTVEQQLQQLQQQHAGATNALQRLQRLQRTMPNLHQRRQLLEQRTTLGELPALAEDCREQRQQAQQALQRIELQQNKYHDERQRCQQARTALEIPESLLTQADSLEELRDMLARQRAAQRDMPTVHEKQAAAAEDIRNILRELGRSQKLDTTEAEQLLIDTASQSHIRQLSQEGIKLNTELDNIQQELAAADQRRQQLDSRLQQLPPQRDAATLRQLLNEINRQGDLQNRLEQAGEQIVQLQHQIERLLAGLKPWYGSAEQAAELDVPLPEAITRYESFFQHLQQDRQRLQQQQENVRQQLAGIDTRIDALERQGAVPSDSALQQARTARNGLWQQLHQLWEAGKPPAPQLVTSYEHKVSAADEAADQLRNDAERAAQYAALGAEQERYQQEAGRLAGALRELQDEADILSNQWQALWEPCAIVPLPPAEMKRWLERHERLLDALAELNRHTLQYTGLEQKINAYQTRLQQTLEQFEPDDKPAQATLTAAVLHAEAIAETLDRQIQEQRQLQRDSEQLDSARQHQQQTLARRRQALEQWQQQWRQALQPLGLSETASAAQAEAVLVALGGLEEKLKDVRRYRLRLEQMTDYARQFSDRVGVFCRHYAPDLQTMAVEEAVLVLNQRLNQGRSDLRERTTLDQRLQEIERELSDLHHERENATALLQRLMHEAGVASPQQLEQVERRVANYRELTARLHDLEQQLSHEGLPLATLEQQIEEVDPDQLPGDIQALQLQTDDLSRQLQQCHQLKGRLESELNAMENAAGAADAAFEAQSALAEIHTQVEQYVELKLCALVLNREIERYREQHQGPVMQRAGELFRLMTLDSFSGLSSAFDASDKLVLRCLRASGSSVGVEGLSEGTRDQLYLALRLASLEIHAAHNEPLPLVVDDILINFDDERSQATLAVLAELAQTIQVLFFTHHARLVELAQSTVPAPHLQICRL